MQPIENLRQLPASLSSEVETRSASGAELLRTRDAGAHTLMRAYGGLRTSGATEAELCRRSGVPVLKLSPWSGH